MPEYAEPGPVRADYAKRMTELDAKIRAMQAMIDARLNALEAAVKQTLEDLRMRQADARFISVPSPSPLPSSPPYKPSASTPRSRSPASPRKR